MSKKLKALLLMASATIGAIQASATTFAFYNGDGFSLADSSGASLLTEDYNFGGLLFGSFLNGFTPTSDNTDLWLANFYGGVTPQGEIEKGEDYTDWSAQFIINDNNTVEVGASLYLWVFTTTSEDSEWLLLTDSSWKTIVASAFGLTEFYDFSSSTTAIIGSFDYASNTAQLASVSGSAVPEPATVAALFGAGVLGFTLWRRKRRA